MKEHFLNIYGYDAWANNKLLDGIRSQKAGDEPVLRLFSHILLSEKVWMLRLKGGEYSKIDMWKTLSLAECEDILRENTSEYKSFIESDAAGDFSKTALYKNTKGIEYSTSYYDVLTHVSLHSAYHRAQVAAEMRRNGKEPVYTDYIAFVREKDKV